MHAEHIKLITSNPDVPAKPRVSLSDAVVAVYAAVELDPTFLDRLLSKLDRDRIERFLRKPNLADFPADVETVEAAIWDNDFGKRVSKIAARYSVQVKANRVGNANLSKRDFVGFADLLTPDQIRKRAKRWGLTSEEKSIFERAVSFADANGLLIGRFMQIVRGQGSHTFKNHFAMVADIHDAPRLILSVPAGNFAYDANKTVDAAGKDFAVLSKASGQKSKVIWQCRHSTSSSLTGWAK